MAVTRMIARPMLSSIFFVGAWSALKNADKLAPRARRVTDTLVPKLKNVGVPMPEDPALLVRAHAVVQLTAAAALATGRMPRLSATVLGVTLVPTTLAGHPFWEETEPADRQQQKLHFAKNLSVLGGLVLAALDTEGKPGVAWRARRAAKDVASQSRHLVKEKSLEAKLAAKSL